MINYDAPFPQADDIEKVFTILNLDDVTKLSDNGYLEIVLGGLTPRQISYYISACDFLGITNRKREYTDFGLHLRTNNENQQIIELAKILFSHPVFSTLLFSEMKYGYHFDHQEVIDIMKKYVSLNSDEMYNRRASTVSSWTHWFQDKLNVNID